jgi:5,10-methylenetetrahydromethanopterin reductase
MPEADTTSRFGLNLPNGEIREYLDLARYADRSGVDSLWVSEPQIAADAIVPLAAYATVTEHVRLGTSVIPIWTRNPALIAQSFATLDQLAPGRILLGLGAWWDPLASQVGVEIRKPIRAMREIIEACRLLWAKDGLVDYDGEFVSLDGVMMEGPRHPHEVRVFIGAVGPQMLRLTGAVADGVILNGNHTVEATAAEIEHLAAGAAAAGRSLDDIEIAKMIRVKIGDRDRLVDEEKPRVARYVAQQPHIAGPAGIDADLLMRLQRRIAWPATPDEVRAGAELLPDEVVNALGCFGDPDQVRARIREYADTGVDLFILSRDSIERMRDAIDVLVGGW